MKHEATPTSIQLVKPRAPSILFFPTFNNSQKNYLLDTSRPNNQFSDKNSYADLFLIVFLSLFGVYILTFFITLFVICKHEDDHVMEAVDFMFCAANYFYSFSQAMINPLSCIFDGTPATVNATSIDFQLRRIYTVAWAMFNENFTRCYERSKDFKKAFD